MHLPLGDVVVLDRRGRAGAVRWMLSIRGKRAVGCTSVAQLADLHEHVVPSAGAFELPEPGDDDVKLVRQFIERAAED